MLHNAQKQSGLKLLPGGCATGRGNLPSALITDTRDLNIGILGNNKKNVDLCVCLFV